jgi:signal transduction histidine kinase/ActR/RegA family two-component response regulator
MAVGFPNPVNILLVDDQPSKLLSYEIILAGLGENLIKTSSAREAFHELLKNDIAVVLIDVQMPELDGFEFAAMIREHPRFQQTPLIFVSAIHLSDLDRIKGYEAGAVDYIPVPVVPEVLRARVRVFAELHRKTRELEGLNAELEKRVNERTAALETSSRALERLNEELERRIAERTREREAALAQLFEAQKIDTIGQLTGGVAHDFNNLLMAIGGSLQILRKHLGGSAPSLRLLDNALSATDRGVALTQRLLAFARRQDLRPERVDVRDLVAGMKDLLARTLGPGVHLRNQMPRKLPEVLIDANQLELALLNLCVNSRDAMPDGGTITISAGAVAAKTADAPSDLKAGDYVRITVIDTGSGMDADVLAHAAEPFFTTKGVGKGTGLGLSMVHGLAAQSGGVLALSSRPGGGAKVDLWIPQAAYTVPIARIPKPAAVRLQPAPPCRIMVVDDDPLVSAGTVAMLEDLGHSAFEASSGAEALKLLESGLEVDVLVTDHAMPQMTGLELARRLRDMRPQLSVILATGYADLPHADADLPRLNKPFLQEELALALARHARPSEVGAASLKETDSAAQA